MGCTVSRNSDAAVEAPSPATAGKLPAESPTPAQATDAAPNKIRADDRASSRDDDAPSVPASADDNDDNEYNDDNDDDNENEPGPASVADNPLNVASVMHGELLERLPAQLAEVTDAHRPRRPPDDVDGGAHDETGETGDAAPLPFFTVMSGEDSPATAGNCEGPSNSSRKPPAGHPRSQQRCSVDNVAAMRTTSRSAIERMASRGPRRSASSFLFGADESNNADGQPSGRPLSATALQELSSTPAQSARKNFGARPKAPSGARTRTTLSPRPSEQREDLGGTAKNLMVLTASTF